MTGVTQQGRVRDDWGNWFGCDNSNLIRHYPLDDRYLKRQPVRHLSEHVGVGAGRSEPESALPDQTSRPTLRTLRPAQLRDGRLRHLHLPRRPARRRLSRQRLHLRTGQPVRASHEAEAEGLHVRRPSAGRRKRDRIPRLDRQLVPPRASPHRPRRLPMDRRHVSLRDRTPTLDSAARRGEARSAGGAGDGADLSGAAEGQGTAIMGAPRFKSASTRKMDYGLVAVPEQLGRDHVHSNALME